ncbi:MAG: PEP-CTERM sorting domain-containing protein [Planctomycetota bacterium]
MRSLVLGLSIVIALACSSAASAMSVIGTAMDTSDPTFGFVSFDFMSVTPTSEDSGTFTLTSVSPTAPTLLSSDVTFGSTTGILDPGGDNPPFTFVYEIVSGLAAASADGMIEINALGAPGTDFLAVLLSSGSSGSVVPEPGTFSMLGIGCLVGCLGFRRKRE